VPGVLVVRLDGPIFFANAGAFADRVRDLVATTEPRPQEVLLNVESWTDIDSTAHEALHELLDDLHEQGIRLSVARPKRRFSDALERSGLANKIDGSYLEVDDGVDAFLERGT
jgi:SulP family sulfate permease